MALARVAQRADVGRPANRCRGFGKIARQACSCSCVTTGSERLALAHGWRDTRTLKMVTQSHCVDSALWSISNAYVFWAIIDPVRARSAFSTITCGKASSSAPPRTGGRRTTHHFAPAKWRRCMGTPALGNARQRPWRTAFADIDRFFLHARERSILDGLGRRQRAQEIAEIVGERMKLTTDGVSGERARYRRSGESVRKPPPDRESRRRRGKPQLRRRSHHVPSS